MRVRAWLSLAAVCLGLAALLAHRRPGSRAPARRGHVRGALHVHSAFSRGDARGSLDEIAGAARGAGLDYLVVTDHNTDAASSQEGYRHGVLLLGGIEKSTDGGHALVLGCGPLPFRLDGEPALVVRDAADLGGFVVAAHPTSNHPEGSWSGGMDGVAGIELLNFAEPSAWPPPGLRMVPTLLRYAVDPLGTLLASHRFSRRALERWDAELAERPLAGVLGSDAHGGFPVGGVLLPFPSHASIFRLASQHLLLAEPLSGRLGPDRDAILGALRDGRGFVAFDSMADASGFRFEAESARARAAMGEGLELQGDVRLHARIEPAGLPATLVLLRNGRELMRGPAVEHLAREPGVYRVEAYLPSPRPDLPWIVSNPIHLFPAALLAEREERARRLPPEDPAPGASERIADFAEPALPERWQIDRAPDAVARAAIEAGALRFDFRLGPGARTHASVCDWGRRDLSEFSSLTFRVRATRRMRFDVQVRVADEGPGGVRIWRRSIRAETDWRPVVLPFARLRTYDRRGGAPRLDRVTGIYLHVDESHLPPLANGTLWIDDLALGR